jgi:hypothetical protein
MIPTTPININIRTTWLNKKKARMKKGILTYKIIASAGTVLWHIGNGLERLE